MAVARFDEIRSIAFGDISPAYDEVGGPLTQNWREFRIINATDADVFISADGTTDNFFIPAFSFLLWDLSANSPPISETDTFVMSIGTQFYCRSDGVLTAGAVYIEGIYARRS